MVIRHIVQLTAISVLFISSAAWAEAQDAFVDSIQIDVTPMASSAVRAASVDWGIDLDHDQFISSEEIELAMIAANENFARASRMGGFAAPQGGWFRNGGRGGSYIGAPRRVRTNSIRIRRAAIRLREVGAAYREFNSVEAEEMSIANADFRVQFADLDGEQRTMLLKADTRGNNDGSLTVVEYVEFNDGPLFFKGRFEREFGEAAHTFVFDTLVAEVEALALDEFEIRD